MAEIWRQDVSCSQRVLLALSGRGGAYSAEEGRPWVELGRPSRRNQTSALCSHNRTL
jgi:hypothetical protein